jgi:hypothetical protein
MSLAAFDPLAGVITNVAAVTWEIRDKENGIGESDIEHLFFQFATESSCRLCGKTPCGPDATTVALAIFPEGKTIHGYGICLTCRKQVTDRSLGIVDIANRLEASSAPVKVMFQFDVNTFTAKKVGG